MELAGLRIQSHLRAVHIKGVRLAAIIADACNRIAAVHTQLNLRAVAVIRTKIEVHRALDAVIV